MGVITLTQHAIRSSLEQAFNNSVRYSSFVSHVNVASVAILIFDWCSTIQLEISSVWRAKLNYTRLMYILTRYSTFVQCIVVMYQITIPGEWLLECSLAFKANAWLFVFGLGTGEIIMTIRTYAVWGSPRWMTFALPIFYVAVWAAGFTAVGIFLSTLEFAPSPLNPFIGCYATRADPIVFVSWLLLLFYDFVMFVLIAIPAWKAYRRGGRSRLLRTVYQDGVLYYLYLFAISLINIIFTVLLPKDLNLLFSLLSRVLHAILSCRVVLHIAEHSGHGSSDSGQAFNSSSNPSGGGATRAIQLSTKVIHIKNTSSSQQQVFDRKPTFEA